MADYSASMQQAEAAIKAKGMPMLFVWEEQSGDFDPSIQGYPTITTSVPTYGVKTSPTVEEVQGGVFAIGSTIVLVAGAVFAQPPRTTGYITFGGHRWNITAFKVVQPAEQAILYKFQVTDAGADMGSVEVAGAGA